MRKLHIIMPMAGEASRFKNVGIDIPKPFIKANGEYFVSRALTSIAKYIAPYNINISFIVREEHIDKYNIDDKLRRIIPASKINVHSVKKTTRGAVETCLIAKDDIKPEDAVLVLDCDLEFDSEDFTNIILNVMYNISDYDGMLLSFNSSDKRYSYAEVDNDNFVIRTAEKNPISNHALAGAYFFSYGSDFVKYASQLITDNDLTNNKEFYTSLIYNYMLNDHKNILLVNVDKDKFASFGTPEELKAYESKSNNN